MINMNRNMQLFAIIL